MGAVSDTPVERFNRRATAQSWHWRCEEALRVESPILAKANALLEKISPRGHILTRSQLPLSAVKSFAGHMMILERLDSQVTRYRVRLMGTSVAFILGELQGATLDEELLSEDAEHWYAALDATLAQQAPLRFVGRISTSRLDFLEAETLMAPLMDDSGHLSQVLAVVAFQACSQPTMSLDEFIASHTRTD